MLQIYLLGFLLSIMLFVITENMTGNIRIILIICALVIPCLIAAFRAQGVGTDTEVYLIPMTSAAIKANNLNEFMISSWYRIWRNLYVRDYEIGFSLFVFFISKIFKSIYAVQFFIQSLVIFPVYIALKKSKTYPIWLGMLIYFLLFYNRSLNLMRQSIAMSFVFLSIQFLSEKNYKFYFLFIIIGLLFHTSALIGLIIGIIFLSLSYYKEINLFNRVFNLVDFITIAYILIGILGIIGINSLETLLTFLGLEKYQYYVSGNIGFMPNQLLVRLPIVALFIYNWKKINKEDTYARFYLLMLYFDILCSQITSMSLYGGRISLYFSQFSILSYSAFTEKGKNRALTVLLILYLIVYWLFFFVLKGEESTVPYFFMQR